MIIKTTIKRTIKINDAAGWETNNHGDGGDNNIKTTRRDKKRFQMVQN